MNSLLRMNVSDHTSERSLPLVMQRKTLIVENFRNRYESPAPPRLLRYESVASKLMETAMSKTKYFYRHACM